MNIYVGGNGKGSWFLQAGGHLVPVSKGDVVLKQRPAVNVIYCSDAFIQRLIEERRADAAERDDLLSILIAARDTETDGGGMTDRQLRDEILGVRVGHRNLFRCVGGGHGRCCDRYEVQSYTRCQNSENPLPLLHVYPLVFPAYRVG